MTEERQGLKLVMAVSYDGFVARHPKDDMSWTDPQDKELFRSLTSVGGTCGVGRLTSEVMPKSLPGRRLVVLSNSPLFGISLGSFAFAYPGAWLLGGQTIAMEALKVALVDEVHLIRNSVELGEGIADQITPFLHDMEGEGWYQALDTRMSFGSLDHEVWRRGT